MILSIITTGRNDDYCGNFVQRLKWQLEKNCETIEKFKLKNVELVVVDWGSPETEKLSDVIGLNKTFLKWIYVPQDITTRISETFSNSHAWNVGARQSMGKYLLHTEGDAYLTQNFLLKLIQYLTENPGYHYSWASRYMIPHKLHSVCTSISQIDQLIYDWLSKKTIWEQPWGDDPTKFHSKIDKHNFGGGGTAQLTSRDIYFDVTGVCEEFTRWGWMDVEFHNRVISKYLFDGDLEEILQENVYSFGHHEISFGGNVHGLNNSIYKPFKANPDDWGLINFELKIYN